MPPKDRGRYKLPVPLPKDMILKDTEGKVWRLGSQIGQGGFGLIYLASPQTHIPVEDNAVHVIKVEYLENGPLFSELKFYQRAAKLQHNCYGFLYLDVIMVPSDQKGPTEACQIYYVHTAECTTTNGLQREASLRTQILHGLIVRKWMNLKKIRCLGIPVFWGSGLAEYKGKSYRFMVMERLGEDLQRIFEDCGGRFKKETVLQLGARILDTLEYIHENEYVHGDIKAANLLLGYTNPHEVYLADYGLSYRYCPNGNHKQYQENPRKGHNGTIKFTSLDAHKGVAEGCVLFARSQLHTQLPVCDGFALVSLEMAGRSAWEREAPSRRGDLEILGYCMLQWLCGKLPWEQHLNDPVAVQTAKTKLMDELPHSVLEWDSSGSSCGETSKFLACVYSLAYDEKPKYEVLKQILLDGLESSETRYDGPLEFSAAASTRNHRAATASKVRLPKPLPKPVQQKQKKMESDERQNKACVGVTGKHLHEEGKPSQLDRVARQAEPQQLHLWKPSPKPVRRKQRRAEEEETKGPSSPRARVRRRQLQPEAEATAVPFHTAAQEPEHAPTKDTARASPAFNTQAIFPESKRTHNQLLTAAHHALSSQEAGSGTTRPPLWRIVRLAFAEDTYPYSTAVLVLLLLIALSLYFL